MQNTGLRQETKLRRKIVKNGKGTLIRKDNVEQNFENGGVMIWSIKVDDVGLGIQREDKSIGVDRKRSLNLRRTMNVGLAYVLMNHKRQREQQRDVELKSN